MEVGVRRCRGFLDIMAQMLAVCNGGAKKTRIMYKANLSHEMLKRYLEALIESGLVESYPSERIYRASPKGLAFMRDYEDLAKMKVLYDSKRSSLLELLAKH